MCDICGCGQPDEAVTILKPGEKVEQHYALHPHTHVHDHGHTHDHDHANLHAHTHGREIEVEMDIMQKNNMLAERNRGYFDAKNIVALNLVSSPGSGKTSVLERTISELKEDITISVIEGDQQTFQDANRIEALNTPVIQVNTGNGCHLDANMISKAVKKLNVADRTLLMIENVGNLVCPALFDLGEAGKVVIISVTEGDDKPIKYPTMFEMSDICIINKIDLLPYVDFDVERCKDFALKVNPKLQFFTLSAKSGEGFEVWLKWLKEQFEKGA
jgi:hydrogenase nickel incorporation protein HypB